MSKTRADTQRARFMAKVHPDREGHWRWDGSRTPRGYGAFDHTTAHRVAWTLFRGPIPERMEVHHLPACLKPWCVNPEHLALLTKSENVREKNERNPSPGMPQRTHCKYGHPLVEGNLYITPTGGRRNGQKVPGRRCRTCVLESRKRQRQH